MDKKGAGIALSALSAFLLGSALSNPHASAVPKINPGLRREIFPEKGIKEEIFDSALNEIDGRNNEAAISKLEFLTSVDPNNPQYYSCLGMLYESSGDKARAAFNLKKSISIEPEIMIFYAKISADYSKAKDYDRAAFYLELVAEKAGKPFHHNFLGMLYSASGRYEESVSEFSKAIELDKLCADAYFNLGFVNYMRYLETNDKSLLKGIAQKFIIANELTKDERAMDFARKAYELSNNVKIDNNPENIENLRWKNYELRVRIDYIKYLKSIMGKEK